MNIKINNKINNNNMMEKVDETMAQNEYSPDYVKIKKENNFELWYLILIINNILLLSYFNLNQGSIV